MAQYMVIERFKNGDPGAVYARFQNSGRMVPPDLFYIDSWLSATNDVCYQLMETDDPSTFEKWTAHWSDLVDFEIIPLKAKPTGD